MLGGWLGLAAYGFQIYFDFSGYSDMAIGLGRIFGFRFNENFDHPYCADSVGTFWRRWHMSPTSWFRDYLYIPLGGNRGGTARTIRNLLIVWFCTGFWHGASWNFILWGLYFAAWLILERYVLRGVLEKTPAILKHLYTLIVVFVGWGLFAMVDLGVCGDYLAACFGGAPLWSRADLFRLRSYAVTLAVLVLASTALGQRLWRSCPGRQNSWPPRCSWAFPWWSARPIWWTAATTPSCISGSERRQRPCPNDTQDFSQRCSASFWGADGVADAPAGPGSGPTWRTAPSSSGRH